MDSERQEEQENGGEKPPVKEGALLAALGFGFGSKKEEDEDKSAKTLEERVQKLQEEMLKTQVICLFLDFFMI